MPTVLRHNGITVMIYTHDHLPKHVHCFSGEMNVIVDLETLQSHDAHKATGRFLRTVDELIEEHREALLAKWDEIGPIP